MPYTPNAVVAHSFSFPDFTFTMNVSGTVTDADIGKAVAIDTTAANTVKLAGNNDHIFGRLETLEQNGLDGLKVGAISRKFRAILPTAASVAVGDEVSGSATAGAVKPTTTQPAEGAKSNRVLQVLTGNRAVVEKL